jgi:hypothetical protein
VVSRAGANDGIYNTPVRPREREPFAAMSELISVASST